LIETKKVKNTYYYYDYYLNRLDDFLEKREKLAEFGRKKELTWRIENFSTLKSSHEKKLKKRFSNKRSGTINHISNKIDELKGELRKKIKKPKNKICRRKK
jgi:hypothetical protein